MREHIQSAVERRFNRRRDDAARTIHVFSARLRTEIELETLAHLICAVDRDTL